MDLRRNVAVADLLTVATLSRTKSTILRLLEDHIFLIAESSFGFLILNILLLLLVYDADALFFFYYLLWKDNNICFQLLPHFYFHSLQQADFG